MTDELGLSNDKDDIKSKNPDISENIDKTQTPPKTQEELGKIFEERFDLFMSQLSTRVEEEQAPVAIAIVVDPKYPATPMIFKTGHIYDQAQLLTNVLRLLKDQMDKELTP